MKNSDKSRRAYHSIIGLPNYSMLIYDSRADTKQ